MMLGFKGSGQYMLVEEDEAEEGEGVCVRLNERGRDVACRLFAPQVHGPRQVIK